MAEVAWVVKEFKRGDGCGVEVYGPVHEGLTSADSEDDAIHVIDRQRFDHHCFRAQTPVRVHEGFPFCA